MINGKNKKVLNFESNDYKNIYIKMNPNSKNIYMKPKERIYQYPQVINNYDVNVKVNIKKLNDNNINIENMNISELLSKKLGCNNKRNKSILNDKNNIFSKTDNNIKFLDGNKIKSITKKENLYNNMIQDLKNEFREIKQKHEMNKENKNNIKDKNYKNIRNYFFNENKINQNKDKNNINIKKYISNHNSVNNSYKKKRNKKNIKENITQELIKENKDNNNNYNIGDGFINKNRTQNNFYKLSDNNNYINFESEKTKIKEQLKNKEKVQVEKNKNENLQNAIIYMNNKKSMNKEKKYMNFTNDFLNNNSRINDDINFINFKDDSEDLDLTLNNIIDIKRKRSITNNIQTNNIIKNYISSLNNSKPDNNKCNSYISKKNISIFNNTNKVLNNELELVNNIEIGQINKNNTKESISKSNQSKERVNKKNQKLLYLDRRINQIKNKMNNKNNDIKHTEIKNMTMEKIISFSFIKNNIKKDNQTNELNLNVINKIYKVQNNIILELKQKQFILKNELIKKYKEIQNFKNICFKLMFYIRDYLFNKKDDKKFLMIQNQIIKENFILRKLFFNKPVNSTLNNINKQIKFLSNLKGKKIFYNTFNKVNDKTNSGQTSDCRRINTSESNDDHKKRNKSIERINDKNLIKINSNNINNKNDSSFKYINFIGKKNKYIGNSNDNLNIKPGKKIKYLVKDKTNLSLAFENIGNSSE